MSRRRTKLSEVFQNARRYVRENYGNLITVDSPIFSDINNEWVVNVKSYYPRIIQDDENNERMLYILTLNKLCQLNYSEEGILIRAPLKSECLYSLRESLNLWKERIERIVVKASSPELARVRTVRHYLRPIEVIVNYVFDYRLLSYKNIEDLTRTKRYMDWINLFIKLKLLESTEKGYTYGESWTGLINEYPNKKEFLERVISYILSERYAYLNEIMNIGQMGTVIHSNNCYYKSCIEADKIIQKYPHSIWKDYVKYYGKKSYAEIYNTLLELSEAKVIEYRKPYFSANEEIFERIMTGYEINPTITPPI